MGKIPCITVKAPNRDVEWRLYTIKSLGAPAELEGGRGENARGYLVILPNPAHIFLEKKLAPQAMSEERQKTK